MGENVQRIVALSRTLELTWSPAARMAAIASRKEHGGRTADRHNPDRRGWAGVRPGEHGFTTEHAHQVSEHALDRTGDATPLPSGEGQVPGFGSHVKASGAHSGAAYVNRQVGNDQAAHAHDVSEEAHGASARSAHTGSGHGEAADLHRQAASLHTDLSNGPNGKVHAALAMHHGIIAAYHDGAGR